MIQGQTLTVAELEAYESYRECTITPAAVPGKVSDVTLDRCTVLAGVGSQSEWLDCTFKGLNLANQDWRQSVVYRCRFQDCQLLGTDFNNAVWKAVVVTQCRADYANWGGATLTAGNWQRTSLREASFQALTVHRGLIFAACDLKRANFWGTALAGVNLTTSEIDQLEIDPDPQHLRGLILDPLQAATILATLGVRFSE